MAQFKPGDIVVYTESCPMDSFRKGDIVQVEYKSPKLIEEWMRGKRPVGPGDVGVVKYDCIQGIQHFVASRGRDVVGRWQGTVTVTFPMLGTYGVDSVHLRVVQRAVQEISEN